MNCISHHHACDCREQHFATLIKANLDCLTKLDEIKNVACISAEEKESIIALVERGYAAIEVAQFAGGLISPELAARLTCCAEEEVQPA